jgi:hypothetical protein
MARMPPRLTTTHAPAHNGRPQRDGSGTIGLALGLLSALTMPVAIFATRYSGSYELLHAGVAVPLALGLGVGAIVIVRRTRRSLGHSLGRRDIRRRARIAWLLGTLGICLGLTAAIALAVYGLLTVAGS